MRADLDIVAQLVGREQRVLDLGCGDGALLQTLIEKQDCRGLGVENDVDRFHACIDRGVPVTHGDLEEELSRTETDSFDWSVLSLTLQAVRHPDRVLEQMRRVAPRQVVSLPNFGHWRLRKDLAVHGRMPVTPLLPYEWFNTPNIHLCTLADFEDLTKQAGMTVDARILVDGEGHRVTGLANRAANLLAPGAVYSLSG